MNMKAKCVYLLALTQIFYILEFALTWTNTKKKPENRPLQSAYYLSSVDYQVSTICTHRF